jgi:hypothetical protein
VKRLLILSACIVRVHILYRGCCFIHTLSTHADDTWTRSVENTREGHCRGRLQPVLLVIFCVRRRLDHMKGVRVASLGAAVAFRFVENGAVDKHEIA